MKKYAHLLLLLPLILCTCTPKMQPASVELVKAASGPWKGVLPCADCVGIAYFLDLKSDGTYTEKMLYQGKAANPFDAKGPWAMTSDSVINLNKNEGEGHQYFKYEGESLQLLDLQGQPIATEIPGNYLLKRPVKQPASTTLPVNTSSALDGKWALESMGGETASAKFGEQAPYLEFQTAEGRLAGFGGCNRTGGGFEVINDSIQFLQLVSTKMACPAVQSESAFLQMISEKTLAVAVDGEVMRLTLGQDVLVFRRVEDKE